MTTENKKCISTLKETSDLKLFTLFVYGDYLKDGHCFDRVSDIPAHNHLHAVEVAKDYLSDNLGVEHKHWETGKIYSWNFDEKPFCPLAEISAD